MLSLFFTLLGIQLAVYSKSVNGFLFSSPLYVPIFILPVLTYLELWEAPILRLLPSDAALQLMNGSIHTLEGYITCILLLLLWIVFAYSLTYKSFYKQIVLKVGGI